MKARAVSLVAVVLGLATGVSLGSAVTAKVTANTQRAEPQADAATQARPISTLVTHADPVLGYRIELPDGYRRSRSIVLPPEREMVGHDAYVARTDAEELRLCLSTQESGLQPPERELDVRVEMYRDVRGVSGAEWIRSKGMTLLHTTIESLTLNGYDAARVVHERSKDAAFYVIRANNRIYVVTRELHAQPSSQPRGWLDQIAATFIAISPTEAAPTPVKPPCAR